MSVKRYGIRKKYIDDKKLVRSLESIDSNDSKDSSFDAASSPSLETCSKIKYRKNKKENFRIDDHPILSICAMKNDSHFANCIEEISQNPMFVWEVEFRYLNELTKNEYSIIVCHFTESQ